MQKTADRMIAIVKGEKDGTVWVQDAICGICGKEIKCLSMDAASSDNEYGNLCICFYCIGNELSLLRNCEKDS